MTEADKPSLRLRSARRMGITLIFLAVLLFVPARSLRFWQGWVFLAIQCASWIWFALVVLKHDPDLAERRLRSKEREPEQKLALKLFGLILYVGFLVAGFDFRLGWSQRWLAPVPLAIVIIGQIVVLAGYVVVFWVLKTNSFAGSTIQVDPGQTVISSGPYALVRHPMYTGMS